MFGNFIRISIKNIRKNKNIFFNSFFLILFLIIIIVTLSLRKTIENFVINDNANNLNHRTFFVSSDNETLDDVYNKLIDIPEINQVSQTYEFSWSGTDDNFKTNDYTGELSLIGVILDNLPSIYNGDLNDYENDDEIIELVCPKTLRPNYMIMFDKNWKDKAGINTTEILNKISYLDGEIEYKIIAAYDTALNNADDFLCYTAPQNIASIYKRLDGDLQGDNYLMAIVDDYQKIDKVLDEFDKLGFNYMVRQETSDDLIASVLTLGTLLAIVMLIISVLILYLNNCKMIHSRQSELYLYRIFGYDFPQIKLILIFENVIVCVISYVIALILSLFGLGLFKLYLLNSSVGNARINVYIDYFSLFLSFAFSIIIPIVAIILLCRKNNQSLIEQVKEDF